MNSTISNEGNSAITEHQQFNASDAEVTFRSSDNYLFRIHRKNLDTNSGGFAPPAVCMNFEDNVYLEESAETLEILFSFIYPKRHPTLEDKNFDVIEKVAEAAEKYEVFAAMNICRIRMRQFAFMKAENVIVYAARHGYKDLVAEAAPLFLFKPFNEVQKSLPPALLLPWVRYRETWHDVLRSSLNTVFSPGPVTPHFSLSTLGIPPSCQGQHADLLQMYHQLQNIKALSEAKRVLSLFPLPASSAFGQSIPTSEPCEGCFKLQERFRQSILNGIGQMPHFIDLL